MKAACRKYRTCFIIPLFLFSAVIYLAVWQIGSLPLPRWMDAFFALIASVFVIEMTAFLFLFREKNGLAAAFILLTILFHFSHILLITIGFDFGSTITNVPFVRFGEDAARQAFAVSVKFQYANFLGFCVYDFFLSKKLEKITAAGIRFTRLKQITYGLFFAGILAWAGYAVRVFLSTRQMGYGKLASSGTDSYIILLGRLFLSALILLIFGQTEKKKSRRKRGMACGIVLYALSMFSGQRAYSLICICILIYIFFQSGIGKRKAGNILLFAVLAFAGAVFLNAIRMTREQGMDFSMFLKSMISVSSSPFLLLINEFAISENVIAKICAQADGFHSGLQFLTSFMIVVPGISYLVPIDFTSLSLAGKLDMWNLGGTFIGDFYFDFGEWGVVFSLFYGILLCGFFYRFQQYIAKKQYTAVSVMAPVLCEFMMSIRSTTYKIPRNTVIVMLMYFGTAMTASAVSAMVCQVEKKKAFSQVKT